MCSLGFRWNKFFAYISHPFPVKLSTKILKCQNVFVLKFDQLFKRNKPEFTNLNRLWINLPAKENQLILM